MAIWANPDRYPPTVNAANCLAEKDHEVTIVGRADAAAQSGGAQYAELVSVRRVGFGAKSQLGRLLGLLRFLYVCVREASRLKPSVIIAYDNFGLLGGRLARLFCRRARFVYHSHDVQPSDNFLSLGGIAWLLERPFIKSADVVVLPDAHRARAYKELMHLTKSPLVVPNAPRMHLSANGSSRLREMTDLFAGKRIIIRHGSIGPGHAIESSLESMSGWPADAMFAVVGNATKEYRAHLLQLADRLGMGERFVLLPFVAYPEILNLIAQADVGLSLYEGPQQHGPWADVAANSFAGTASNKALEFLATGVPFLVNNHPSSAIFVEAGVALAVDPLDPREVGAAVTKVSEPALRAEMSARAVALHRDCLHFERGFSQLEAALGIAGDQRAREERS